MCRGAGVSGCGNRTLVLWKSASAGPRVPDRSEWPWTCDGAEDRFEIRIFLPPECRPGSSVPARPGVCDRAILRPPSRHAETERRALRMLGPSVLPICTPAPGRLLSPFPLCEVRAPGCTRERRRLSTTEIADLNSGPHTRPQAPLCTEPFLAGSGPCLVGNLGACIQILYGGYIVKITRAAWVRRARSVFEAKALGQAGPAARAHTLVGVVEALLLEMSPNQALPLTHPAGRKSRPAQIPHHVNAVLCRWVNRGCGAVTVEETPSQCGREQTPQIQVGGRRGSAENHTGGDGKQRRGGRDRG